MVYKYKSLKTMEIFGKKKNQKFSNSFSNCNFGTYCIIRYNWRLSFSAQRVSAQRKGCI